MSIPALRCGACIVAVEQALMAQPGVSAARVNLSTRRAAVIWTGQQDQPPAIFSALASIGYPATLASEERGRDEEVTKLFKAVAVAGFSAMNIMLLSVSAWSGADGDVRQGFHLVSAALALPALIYSGRIFFISAWSALRAGRTNMDVPISVGLVLAFGLSLYDVSQEAPHAYFDAATSLIFFLLIGRTLELLMRERSRSAVSALSRLEPAGGHVVGANGETIYLPLHEIKPAMQVIVNPGHRVPVDGIVRDGVSELDASLITGESRWSPCGPGTLVQAGVLNQSGRIVVEATATATTSFLAQMVNLMQAAEQGGPQYRGIAERAARLYSPVIHTLALFALVGWLQQTGDWHQSLSVAISVLIITCPCALGLAVPITQVIAARRLFQRGIIMKDGAALERLAEASSVTFDKTGTLTFGQYQLVMPKALMRYSASISSALAKHSRHPAAVAIARSVSPDDGFALDHVEEIVGCGVEAVVGTDIYRLGRPAWAIGEEQAVATVDESASRAVLSKNGTLLESFELKDQLRPGTVQLAAALRKEGYPLSIVSGDNANAVSAIASKLQIQDASANLLPVEKLERVRRARDNGEKVLMIGDGLNDAPALAAAYVSMAPATAAEVGRKQADFVFMSDDLRVIGEAIFTAKWARRIVRQNLGMAIIYNAVCVPIAVAGFVTPLVAAIAMSFSSIAVIANALRLSSDRMQPLPFQPKESDDAPFGNSLAA
ncbi:heavy metal translocating P-type ATPase [Rhizobium sp. Root149]|uniref:heavy metal translocating P-type ATPase n=1 Tax=Rhizobium sp. Root149 TaxID=1736473 RepID=UPI00244E8BFF|nr:heavy metal translocating P-type ATPase [Rhizobium sp. Root149]